MDSADREFIYVGDPMCSWCWGFAPVLEQLDARWDIPLRVVVGGLRPGASSQVVDGRLRGFLAEHWDHVEEASGQPFDRRLLARDGWVYDTEPSCRAVVAMRQLAPALTLPWFARLQKAFYAEGLEITRLDAFPALAKELLAEQAVTEVTVDEYRASLLDPATHRATWDDFAEARQYGATGFPTLLYRDGPDLAVVTQGWVAWEHLDLTLTRWFDRRYDPQLVAALSCSLDDPC